MRALDRVLGRSAECGLQLAMRSAKYFLCSNSKGPIIKQKILLFNTTIKWT